MRIEFDRLLRTSGTNPLNWVVKADIGAGNEIRTPQAGGTILSNFVTMQTAAGGVAFPPLGISYSATVPTIFSKQGAETAPFADMKLFVV